MEINTISEKQAERIAHRLYTAIEEKRAIQPLTNEFPEITLATAYHIQTLLVDRLKRNEHDTISAIKLGLTSAAKQRALGIREPAYGYVLKHMTLNAWEDVKTSQYIQPRIEPEIGIVLKRPFTGASIPVAEILPAIDYVFPLVEIIDSRFEGYKMDIRDGIMDNISAAGVVFGCDISSPEKVDLDKVGVSVRKNGEIVETGLSSAVMGNPAYAVSVLIRMLYRQGQQLPAYTPIMTGGITNAVPIQQGDMVEVQFVGLGTIGFRCM